MVLRAGVERALRTPGTPPESLQSLDESLMHIGRMAELVDSLLTLARADEGRLPLAVGGLRPARPGRRSRRDREHSGEAGGLTVTRLIPRCRSCCVDRNRIAQLLLNLVTNAVKYTRRAVRVPGALRSGRP
jgi:signal transduction histidine kinase